MKDYGTENLLLAQGKELSELRKRVAKLGNKNKELNNENQALRSLVRRYEDMLGNKGVTTLEESAFSMLLRGENGNGS